MKESRVFALGRGSRAPRVNENGAGQINGRGPKSRSGEGRARSHRKRMPVGPPTAIQEAIQRYVDLYDFAPLPFVNFNRAGRIDEVNLATTRLLGRARDLLVGCPFSLFVITQDLGLFLAHLSQCRSFQRQVATELRLKSQGGGTIFARLESRAVSASMRDGAMVFQTAIIDLTEHQRAAEAIRQSQERYQTLFDLVPVAVYACDAKGVILEYNRRATELWGAEPDKNGASPRFCGSYKIYYPDGRPMPHKECPMARALAGKKLTAADLEIIVERPDGERRHVIPSPKIIRNAAGRITGAINCLYDITNRKRDEQRLTEQARLLDLTTDAIIVRGRNDRILYWNKGAEQLYGYTQREALGKITHEFLKTSHPAERGAIMKVLERDRRWQGELVHHHKEGKPLTVLSRWSLDRDGTGEHHAVLETNTDITARKQAQERIEADLEVITLLHDLGQEFARRDSGLETKLNKTLEIAKTIGEADKGHIQLFDEKTQSLKIAVQSGFGTPFLEFFAEVKANDRSVCDEAGKFPKPVVVEDIQTSGIFAGQDSRKVLLEAGVRGVQSIPLLGSSKKLIGMISIYFRKPHQARPRESRFLDLLVRQLANYLERRHAQNALAETVHKLEALYEFVQRRAAAKSLPEIYSAALETILKALPCNRASILFVDDKGIMRFVDWRGLSERYRKAVEGHSPWKAGERNPQPICISEVDLADIPLALKKAIRQEGIRAVAFIPLVADGTLIGKFTAYYNQPHAFKEEEIDLAITIGRQLAHGIQRKRSEEALADSEARLRAIVDQATAGMARTDREGRVVFANRRLCELFGYPESEIIGTRIRDFTHPDDRKKTADLYANLLNEGAPYELEKRYLRKDGSIIWGSVSTSPVRDLRGKIQSAVAVIIDITSRKQAEAELRRSKEMLEELVQQRTHALRASNIELQNEINRRRGLEGQILEISDREQQRLAQELHDGLCQELTAIGFMARATALRVRDHRVLHSEDIDKIATLVNAAATDARNISRALHRVDVDAGGFVDAIQNLATREIWRTPCLVDVKKDFHVENDATAANLYGIAREAVVNANKHASARQIVIELKRRRKEIILSICDDGSGLKEKKNQGRGMGFHIMDYRARSIGGTLEVESAKGAGTRVSCRCPVQI